MSLLVTFVICTPNSVAVQLLLNELVQESTGTIALSAVKQKFEHYYVQTLKGAGVTLGI